MTASLTTRDAELEAAHRHSAMLKAAMPRHACWCGAFGADRFTKGGPWFCGAHVERGADRVPVRGIGADEFRGGAV